MSLCLEGNRAEAWFQIRYGSNGNNLGGLAKRRFYESEVFGLYSAAATSPATIGIDEAKSVLQVYTQHQKQIFDYEKQFGAYVGKANADYRLGSAPIGSYTQELEIARGGLIANFAQFAGAPTIDGEVLVGADTASQGDILDASSTLNLSKNDLILGEAGNDTLRGQGGSDVLYGGEGNDTLSGGDGNDFLFGDGGDDTLQGGDGDDTIQGNEGRDEIFGGKGNDLLKGGAGNDIYRYTTGDGHDTIEDTEGKDAIFVDGRLLTSVSQPDPAVNEWKSLDGVFTYTKSGGDVLVRRTGTPVVLLTLNENFQNCQFGIVLQDAPSYDNNLETRTNSDYPGVFTELSNSVFLSGPYNNNVHGLGGNDAIFASIDADGHDQLFGRMSENHSGRKENELLPSWDRVAQ